MIEYFEDFSLPWVVFHLKWRPEIPSASSKNVDEAGLSAKGNGCWLETRVDPINRKRNHQPSRTVSRYGKANSLRKQNEDRP